jgi:hypothetical protein
VTYHIRKGFIVSDFTKRAKENWVNTFILNSRYAYFCLPAPTSQFPHSFHGFRLLELGAFKSGIITPLAEETTWNTH